MAPFVVVYDACVLYPSLLRNLLIRIAQSGLVQAKWTDKMLDEAFDNLAENRPELDPAKLARTRQQMNAAVRGLSRARVRASHPRDRRPPRS
jgi:hypothetical protein